MWHEPGTAAHVLDSSEGRILLLESEEHWILTRIADSRLEVGSVFRFRGVQWTVVWEGAVGFGENTVH